MGIKVKESKWVHGSVIYRNLVVWVQQAEPGQWFAAIRDKGLALLAYTGPWPSQGTAQKKLIDAFNAIYESES